MGTKSLMHCLFLVIFLSQIRQIFFCQISVLCFKYYNYFENKDKTILLGLGIKNEIDVAKYVLILNKQL